MKIFNDILGEYIEIPENPRIVSLAPSLTDTLIQLDAWDNVVGISIYCKIPEKYPEKPRVGSYLKVIYKRLDELNPDIILLTTGAQRSIINELKEKGYNVYPTPLPVSVDGILDILYVIGNIVGKRDVALERIRSYHSLLSSIEKKVYSNVYYEIDLGGPITIGGPSYITSGLFLIGLRNIFLDQQKPYFEPEFEKVREINPNLIIYEESKAKRMTLDKLIEVFRERGWTDIDAVKKRKILILEEDTLAHYGPSFITNLKEVDEKIRKLL